MKYRRLTKEQLEELHPEFINFLATQSITAEEWDTLKKKKPEVAEEEIVEVIEVVMMMDMVAVEATEVKEAMMETIKADTRTGEMLAKTHLQVHLVTEAEETQVIAAEEDRTLVKESNCIQTL